MLLFDGSQDDSKASRIALCVGQLQRVGGRIHVSLRRDGKTVEKLQHLVDERRTQTARDAEFRFRSGLGCFGAVDMV